MKHLKIVLLAALLLAGSHICKAQRWGISTNVVDWAYFGTMNVEFTGAVHQHWSLNLATRYNPWTWRKGENQLQERTRTASVGTRYWFWYVYSGWWLGARAQWEEYNRGGLLSKRTEEGDAYGLALSAGYTLMLHKNLNIEFGLGGWGGIKNTPFTVARPVAKGKRKVRSGS